MAFIFWFVTVKLHKVCQTNLDHILISAYLCIVFAPGGVMQLKPRKMQMPEKWLWRTAGIQECQTML